jgi:hypothetical protein
MSMKADIYPKHPRLALLSKGMNPIWWLLGLPHYQPLISMTQIPAPPGHLPSHRSHCGPGLPMPVYP